MQTLFNRVIWVVLDGVGAGALPDAALYGDEGANTLGSLGPELKLPNLENLGLGNITAMKGVRERRLGQGAGAFGRALEKSAGKDTTSGHWEMAGLVVKEAFPVFPKGFPKEIVDQWVTENQLSGVLGNKPASGTEIIKELGEEHVRSGKPILYTSADSVWQVAAHEKTFGLDRLYSICKSARKNFCDPLRVSRVIARPFVGNPAQGKPYQRTYHRKDYSIRPHGPLLLNLLENAGVRVFGIGKISSIFAGEGVSENQETEGNTDGIRVLKEHLGRVQKGLIFCNLIDFDMLYGHRRDVKGFENALQEFDRALPEIQQKMTDTDLLLLTADHGNDPSFRGTDHTREYMPILAYSPLSENKGPVEVGMRECFADVGATTVEALLGPVKYPAGLEGTSFLSTLAAGWTR